MKKEDFLKKLETELKIAKNSPHTIKNYLKANSELLTSTSKEPEQITSDDVLELIKIGIIIIIGFIIIKALLSAL